mgnify:CR=1 FL=1
MQELKKKRRKRPKNELDRGAQKEQKNLTASVENWKLELENAQQQKVNGRNRVKVDIYFTAVEIVNIPTETEMKAAMEELQRSRNQAITT